MKGHPGTLLEAARRFLYLYIFCLPLVLPFSFRFRGLQVQFVDAVFLVSLSFWAAAIVLGKAKLQSTRLYPFLALYLGAMSISTLFSTDPQASLVKLVGVFYLAAVAVLTFNLCSESDVFRKILIAFLLGSILSGLGMVAGVIGFYLNWDITRTLLSHYGSLPAGNYPRVRSFFANANMACNFLNVVIAGLTASIRLGWLRPPVYLVTAVLITISALFTFSPGIGGVVLSIGMFYWATNKTVKPGSSAFALWGSAIFALAVFGSTTIDPKYILGSLDETQTKYSVRVQVWQNSFERAAEFPFVGRGTGTNAAAVHYAGADGHQQFLTDAHNAWLNILGQSGLIGLIAFVLLCWYCWSLCRFQVDITREDGVVLVAVSSAFAGAFIYQDLAGSFEDARHIWILIGLIAAAHRRYTENEIARA